MNCTTTKLVIVDSHDKTEHRARLLEVCEENKWVLAVDGGKKQERLRPIQDRRGPANCEQILIPDFKRTSPRWPVCPAFVRHTVMCKPGPSPCWQSQRERGREDGQKKAQKISCHTLSIRTPIFGREHAGHKAWGEVMPHMRPRSLRGVLPYHEEKKAAESKVAA